MHNDFTLFTRTYPNGTKVVFYHAYDEDGRRVGPWTTNSQSRTLARNYCNKLLRAGELIPNKNKKVTFGDFSVGFWERGSEYIQNQESRGEITDTYLSNCQKMLANQILPFFKDTPLRKITSLEINSWLLGFKNREMVKGGEKVVMHYQNTYANTVFGTLNVMLTEAVRQNLIPINPCDKVKRLKNDKRKREILTPLEVKKLFPANYKKVWNNELAYIANRLGSLTGMRIGEILGLRGEYVFEKHIYVCGQYGEFGYKDYTKTKENRKIPLMLEAIALLKKLKIKNGKGFVFSLDGGATPVSNTMIRRALEDALLAIGISGEEAKRRRLTLHGWRHFVNTDMLRQGLTTEQVQAVTGHKSKEMTDGNYNHIDPTEIADVIKAQRAIAGKKKQTAKKTAKKNGKEKSGTKTFTLVKTTGRRSA